MKKFLIALFVVAVVAVSHASILYWQVTGDDLDGVAYNRAALYSTDGNTSSLLQQAEIGSVNSVDVAAMDSLSFFVELINYENGTATNVGVGQTVAYTDLRQYITDDNLSVPMTQVWHGGTMTVPEPTSGFLMMVGLALLGLKRRKV